MTAVQLGQLEAAIDMCTSDRHQIANAMELYPKGKKICLTATSVRDTWKDALATQTRLVSKVSDVSERFSSEARHVQLWGEMLEVDKAIATHPHMEETVGAGKALENVLHRYFTEWAHDMKAAMVANDKQSLVKAVRPSADQEDRMHCLMALEQIKSLSVNTALRSAASSIIEVHGALADAIASSGEAFDQAKAIAAADKLGAVSQADAMLQYFEEGTERESFVDYLRARVPAVLDLSDKILDAVRSSVQKPLQDLRTALFLACCCSSAPCTSSAYVCFVRAFCFQSCLLIVVAVEHGRNSVYGHSSLYAFVYIYIYREDAPRCGFLQPIRCPDSDLGGVDPAQGAHLTIRRRIYFVGLPGAWSQRRVPLRSGEVLQRVVGHVPTLGIVRNF